MSAIESTHPKRGAAYSCLIAIIGVLFISGCGSDPEPPSSRVETNFTVGNSRTEFRFDASSSELGGCGGDVEYRWDTDGSGNFGEWSENPFIDGITFSEPGQHTVTVEIRCDSDGEELKSKTGFVVEIVEHDYPNITTWIGTGVSATSPSGAPLRETGLATPADISFTPDGSRAYVADWNNHRILEVRDGRTYVVCGTGTLGDAPEGSATGAGLNHPTNISVDPQGRLIMSAWHNSMIMRIDPNSDSLVRLAGRRPPPGENNGNRCYDAGDEGNPAVDGCLDLPSSTAFDSDGNLYISDQKNTRVVKVNAVSGEITDNTATGTQSLFETVVGVPCDNPASLVQPCPDGGYNGHGIPAVDAYLRAPGGQSADPTARIEIHDDVLYIADSANHMIRKVDLKAANPTIELVAGTEPPGTFPPFGFDGDDGPATSALMRSPRDVAVDSEGNVFICDYGNHRVRRVDAVTGIITTVVGSGEVNPDCVLSGDCDNTDDEAFGDGGAALDAFIAYPYGIALDPDDNLYVVDSFHNRVRLVKK